MYLCIYVCMYVWLCMYVCMHGCMYAWIYVCMYVCVYVCICVCMCVCVCVHACVRARAFLSALSYQHFLIHVHHQYVHYISLLFSGVIAIITCFSELFLAPPHQVAVRSCDWLVMRRWPRTKAPQGRSSHHWVLNEGPGMGVPSGYVNVAIENGHLFRGFSHEKWWFSIANC